MNRDELEGKTEVLKAKIKQATGNLTHNPDVHDEGVIDEVAGKTQAAVGRVRRKVGEGRSRRIVRARAELGKGGDLFRQRRTRTGGGAGRL